MCDGWSAGCLELLITGICLGSEDLPLIRELSPQRQRIQILLEPDRDNAQ